MKCEKGKEAIRFFLQKGRQQSDSFTLNWTRQIKSKRLTKPCIIEEEADNHENLKQLMTIFD